MDSTPLETGKNAHSQSGGAMVHGATRHFGIVKFIGLTITYVMVLVMMFVLAFVMLDSSINPQTLPSCPIPQYDSSLKCEGMIPERMQANGVIALIFSFVVATSIVTILYYSVNDKKQSNEPLEE